jgi:uncharacterized repeat protein (TIGR01451 family)
MKRLLIRMSALATVVALGLIAIAQAQRGLGDRPVEAEAAEASGSAASEEGLFEAGGTAAEAPGLFPAPPVVNPLRSPNSDPTAPDVLATAGESSEPYPGATGTPGSPAVVPAVGIETEDRRPQTIIEAPAGAALNDPGSDPGTLAPPAFPQLPNATQAPAASTAPAATTPLRPNPAESLVGERYQGQIVSPADPGEPGRLQFDPNAPVTSLPSSSGPAGGGFALPGSRPLAGQMDPRTAGTGTPGSRQLEGPQTPQLTVEKFPPQEMQVGKEATFRVKVTNTGQIPAHGVEIRDEIPKGTRLVTTSPQAARDDEGALVWSLGTVEPGAEASVEVQVMPEEEGDIGSVATVSFRAEASAHIRATRPELVIRTSGPSQVLIGEEVKLTITVENPGTGTAYGVVLEDHVPLGLHHPAGEQLEREIGDLEPKGSRQLELTLVADAPGLATNVILARADANLQVEERTEIEVLAPELDLALQGPRRRFLEREATYTLSITNPGTAPARNLELIAHLPAGLEFIDANNYGHYDAASRAVYWNLEELPAAAPGTEPGAVRLTTMPVEAGEQVLRFTCTGEPGLSMQTEQPVLIEEVADVSFQVVDVEDPIELGGETSYEIRIVNRGTKAATNVQVWAILPPGMQAMAAEGPTQHAGVEAGRVSFQALPRLAPKADVTYRVRVRGLQPGDLRLRVQLLTDEMETDTPVTKEEVTRVYSDK